MVRIVDQSSDGEIERVWIAEVEGVLEVHAQALGVECVLESKRTLEDVGVVMCLPIDPKWSGIWPFYVDLEVDGQVTRLWGAMKSRRGLEALRLFWQLDGDGQAQAGLEL